MTYTESFSETLSESVVREPWDVTEGAVSQGVSNPAHCSTMHFLWMVFTHSGRETHNLETDLSSAQPHDYSHTVNLRHILVLYYPLAERQRSIQVLETTGSNYYCLT